MLCATDEGGRECYPYWPAAEGESAMYGKIQVTFQSEVSYGDFCTRKFLIQEEKVPNC